MQNNRDIYSVTRLNQEVRDCLEANFITLWVEGEISNLARPSSGHMYFSLKDKQAQVRCALFRNRARFIPKQIENGKQVLVRAAIGIFESRGDYQLIVEELEEAGVGALRRDFELLKQRLAKEGLFAEQKKRPVPQFASRIGVITSPSGAAIRDILHVLKRRFPATSVLIYSVPVQGPTAAHKIAQMITLAGKRKECDVLLLARGGGSIEDLWSFNEEIVARAISLCELPIVTGIGHEIDFTIADFTADQRAPTPSAAAELLSPQHEKVQEKLAQNQRYLYRLLRNMLIQHRQKLHALHKSLFQHHPKQRLTQQSQRLDDLEMRLKSRQSNMILQKSMPLNALLLRLNKITPKHYLQTCRNNSRDLWRRLYAGTDKIINGKRQHLMLLVKTLETTSPLATLARGYAIVTRCADEKLIDDIKQVNIGEQIQTQLLSGALICRVEGYCKDTKKSQLLG